MAARAHTLYALAKITFQVLAAAKKNRFFSRFELKYHLEKPKKQKISNIVYCVMYKRFAGSTTEKLRQPLNGL